MKQQIQTEVRIKNTDKKIFEVFNSLELAECYIKENEIQSAYGADIIIEEVITYKVETLIDVEISLNNRQAILDLLRNCIPDTSKADFFVDPNHYFAHYAVYAKYTHKTNKVFHNKFLAFLLDNTELTEDDFLNCVNENNPDYWKKLQNIAVQYSMVYFKYILESPVEDFKFFRISTNYKPCNAIILYIENHGYIHIREEDVLLTPHDIYGRKVSIRSRHKLFDSDINHKIIKNLKARANKN